MTSPADNLRELHSLHQRAKAIRDRLASGPKTLAGREAALATRTTAIEKARKDLMDVRAHNKNREVQLQQVEARIDDLKVKRNSAKKQVDYDAITNQIAHDQSSKARIEDEILQAFEAVERQTTEVEMLDREHKALVQEIAALKAAIESQSSSQQAQLIELDAAILAAEEGLPADQRDQYRRVVKQRGPDAMAAIEINDPRKRDIGSCSGCYVTVTTQMLNELHSANALVFCKTCGRILYLPEEDVSNTRRTVV
jgi:predicted  nucleic acid-binding Zn-ribbon protein